MIISKDNYQNIFQVSRLKIKIIFQINFDSSANDFRIYRACQSSWMGALEGSHVGENRMGHLQ